MQKVYTTKRLILRRLTKSDYGAWLFAQENCHQKQDKFDQNPMPHSKRTRAFFNSEVAKYSAFAKKDEAYIWHIFLRKSGKLVGWVDISPISRDPYQMANLGYFIINTYRRKGYAQEAVRRIIVAGFRDLKFHRLEAAMDLDNRGSVSLAKNCGLHKEGIKKHYWLQNGSWEDQMVYIATPELFR